jgi:hypothetical protein
LFQIDLRYFSFGSALEKGVTQIFHLDLRKKKRSRRFSAEKTRRFLGGLYHLDLRYFSI